MTKGNNGLRKQTSLYMTRELKKLATTEAETRGQSFSSFMESLVLKELGLKTVAKRNVLIEISTNDEGVKTYDLA